MLLLVIPWVAGVIATLLPTNARNRAAVLSGLAAMVGLVGVALHFPKVRAGGLLVERLAWVPSLGLALLGDRQSIQRIRGVSPINLNREAKPLALAILDAGE